MNENGERDLNSRDSFVSMVLGLAVILVVGLVAFNYFSGRGADEPTAEEQAALEEQERMTPPTTHVVAEGDTLWSIAETYYGSGYNWVDLSSANSLAYAGYIQAGQEIQIPDVEPILPEGVGEVSGTATMAEEEAPAPTTYVVVDGDHLWGIAMRHYNDGYRWVDIANANNMVNPNLLFVGDVLELP